MKKIASCCLLILVFFIGVAATLGYLAWRKREAREAEAPAGIELASALEARKELDLRFEDVARDSRGSRIVLSEEDLAALVTTSLADNPRTRDYIGAAREIRADVEEGSLEIGVNLNLESLKEIGLSDAETEVVERITGMLPLLGDRDLYLGVRGVPGAVDGKIAMVEDVSVKIGFLTFSLDDLAQHLGISAAKAYSKLAFEVDRFAVDQIAAGSDELELEIRVR